MPSIQDVSQLTKLQGQRLQAALDAKGLKPNMLAFKIGVHKSIILDHLNDRTQLDIYYAFAVCNILGESYDDLFPGGARTTNIKNKVRKEAEFGHLIPDEIKEQLRPSKSKKLFKSVEIPSQINLPVSNPLAHILKFIETFNGKVSVEGNHLRISINTYKLDNIAPEKLHDIINSYDRINRVYEEGLIDDVAFRSAVAILCTTALYVKGDANETANT